MSRPVHPDLRKKVQRMLLKAEGQLTPDQKPLWAEVYQLVGPEDPFLLLGLMGYIRHGSPREFVLACAGVRQYTIPVGLEEG